MNLSRPLQLALVALPLAAAGAHDFPVKLENCSEFIGVASLPLSKLQPLVPSGYVIAAGPPGMGSLVVRASQCLNASVADAPKEMVRVAQIGVVLIPPDGTGDINNYTLSYTTNSLRLAARLGLAGLSVFLDPNLVYEITPDPPGPGGELFAEVTALGSPGWFLSGIVTDPPPGPNFPFTANWWANVHGGRMKMSTVIPALNYGSGSVKVYTQRQSLLGGLFGGNSSSFGTNLRGVFAAGVMTVTAP